MVLYARVTTKVTSGRLSSSKDGICTIFDSSSSSSRCNSNGSCSSNGISKIIIMISHNCERSFCFSNVKITLIEAVADSSNVPSQLSVHAVPLFSSFTYLFVVWIVITQSGEGILLSTLACVLVLCSSFCIGEDMSLVPISPHKLSYEWHKTRRVHGEVEKTGTNGNEKVVDRKKVVLTNCSNIPFREKKCTQWRQKL